MAQPSVMLVIFVALRLLEIVCVVMRHEDRELTCEQCAMLQGLERVLMVVANLALGQALARGCVLLLG